MPPAARTAPLEPVRRNGDWLEDFALAIDQPTQAQNLTNVTVTLEMVKRVVAGDTPHTYSVSTADYITVQGAAGRIAVRVPQAVVTIWVDGIYDASLILTWPNDVRDVALVVPVKVQPR